MVKNYLTMELKPTQLMISLVNEQNPLAKGFYEHLGFKTYKRTTYDEQGNPYPLLYMKR